MKSGNILLIGPTNSGKSTLLNQVVGKRVSLVSRKKQSTTFNLKSVINISEAELILQDTPGIFFSAKKISNKMSNSAITEIDSAVVIYLVIDASKKFETSFKKIINTLKEKIEYQKIFLILNKIDKIKKSKTLIKIEEYKNYTEIDAIFPISAKEGTGINNLLTSSIQYLPKKKNKYSKTKEPLINKDLFYSEITREKIYDKIHKEIPYQCRVITEKIEKSKDQIRIHQVIKVSKKSHKNIIIGKKGSTLKEIGTLSRREISNFENKKIHLFLFVKVDTAKKL